MAVDSYADLLEGLFADYEQQHGLMVIERVVAACRRDLAGEHASGAALELLDRLARQRLDATPTTRNI